MLRGLADYGGDSGDEQDENDAPLADEKLATNPVKRKCSPPDQPNAPLKRVKALPKLDDSLFVPAPVDDPSKHQGRKRTIPYVEGQFVAHVYVPVKLGSELLALLGEIVQFAQTTNSGWHSLLEPVSSSTAQKDVGQPTYKFCPHLSLSRPVPLRAHQRDDFRKEVRKAAQKCCQFSASFVQLTTLTNDDKSRTFLCVEIGAGHQEFQLLSQSLASHLTSLRQLPYYAQPRFHISIAWILTPVPTVTTLNLVENGSTHADMPKGNSRNQELDEFFVATDLAVKGLQSRFSSRLLDMGKFNARSIEVKIGKDIHKWHLASPT